MSVHEELPGVIKQYAQCNKSPKGTEQTERKPSSYANQARAAHEPRKGASFLTTETSSGSNQAPAQLPWKAAGGFFN